MSLSDCYVVWVSAHVLFFSKGNITKVFYWHFWWVFYTYSERKHKIEALDAKRVPLGCSVSESYLIFYSLWGKWMHAFHWNYYCLIMVFNAWCLCNFCLKQRFVQQSLENFMDWWWIPKIKVDVAFWCFNYVWWW